MAQRLLEKYKMPYLSIDHLKMGIYRADPDCGFHPEDSTEWIGEKLWPIIKGIIMTNIENNQNIIIEGCYIQPHHISEFDQFYSKNIISVFLGFSIRYIQEHFHSEIIKHRNIIEERGYEGDQTIQEYIQEQDEIRENCLKHHVSYFEIEENYVEEIKEVYDYIDQKKEQ